VDLFVYGTLLFPEVLAALLDRVPPSAPACAPGWRVAALPGRLYPGLVTGVGAAQGLVLHGLSGPERALLDAYEDTDYTLTEITLAGGQRCHTYVWQLDAEPHDWNRDAFAAEHLVSYAAHCSRWRAGCTVAHGGARSAPYRS
jgi:gamma-glutamylcyclotransferase (GGCT)/AIG2-like uncharacterized protein YtfP